MQLSLDGVQEAKSSSVTIDVFTVTFRNCKKVYPLKLIRPINKYKYNEQDHIKSVIDDINDNNVEISECIFDKPKRSTVKCVMGHSSSYPCEYCEGCAVSVQLGQPFMDVEIRKKYDLRKKNIKSTITFLRTSPGTVSAKEKDNIKIAQLTEALANLKEEEQKELNSSRKKKLAMPFSTMKATLRSTDIIKHVVNKLNRHGDLDKHEKKGIKGQSHLLYQQNFNFINCIPAEYMHSLCLGVGHRLIELTFKVGEIRQKNSNRKLSDPALFNEAIRNIQVVREFGRRCRNLDVSTIKAQEYRNIIIFFFIIVVNCIESTHPKEKMIWLYLAYMTRACIVPNEEFENIANTDVKNACEKFYSLFEKCFGKNNCTYSVHVVPSHLLRIRGDKPFTETSAFVYESFYSEMKQLFQPGTNSTLKQILQNTLMKRILEQHSCKKPIKYSVKSSKKKGLENNSIVYVYNHENEHEFYNILEINENDSFTCQPRGRFEYRNPLTPELKWNTVGVYEVGPSSSETKIIQRKDIKGKAIVVEKLIITCPINVLQEQ